MEDKEFEYKEEYGWITNICLNVTDACNLACRYCFVEQHPHYMTLDVAKQAVHFILNNLEKKNKKFGTNEEASIAYFGGEPVLMWDEIIVPLTNYIRTNNYPIKLMITTNGTLLNEERISFLKEQKIYPLLSIDGDKNTQDYNRPCRNHNESSFKLIEPNIPILLKNFPNMCFRATIFPKTASQTFENFIYAVKMGFKNIYMCPDERHFWSEQEKLELKKEVNKIFTYLDFCYSNNIKPIQFSLIDEMFITMVEHDLDILLNRHKKEYISRSIFRCGLGTTTGAIGFDGSIYGCQEQVSKFNKNNIFYIGNLNKGIDCHRHQVLLNTYSKTEKGLNIKKELCTTCLLKNNCQNFGCPSTNLDLFNNFFIKAEIFCLWRQWIFLNCIKLNHKLVEENNLNFKNYFEKIVNKNRKDYQSI